MSSKANENQISVWRGDRRTDPWVLYYYCFREVQIIAIHFQRYSGMLILVRLPYISNSNVLRISLSIFITESFLSQCSGNTGISCNTRHRKKMVTVNLLWQTATPPKNHYKCLEMISLRIQSGKKVVFNCFDLFSTVDEWHCISIVSLKALTKYIVNPKQ